MTVKIPLRLRGLDLRDVDAYDLIPPDLADLSWEANGGVSLAVVYSDDPVPVAAAVDSARRIVKLMPGVEVAEVHDELVSIPDIAARAGVAAEAVRLWALGKRRASLRPFPAPRQVVGSGSGGKSMSLYGWRDVVSWIRDVIGIDPDGGIDYLNDAQHAELNVELVSIVSAAAWHAIDAGTARVTVGVNRFPGTDYGAVGLFGAELSDEGATTGHRGRLRVALK